MIEYVCHAVPIQTRDESRQSFIQHTLETTHAGNGTRICLVIEALGKAQIWFRDPDYVSEVNLARLARKHYTTGSPRVDVDVFVFRERLNYAHEVIF
jgi:hypothetical protein